MYDRTDSVHIGTEITMLTYISIARVFGGMVFMVIFHGRWRIIIGTAPTLYLTLTVFFDCLFFVFSDCGGASGVEREMNRR
jgi:hypothetical protein